ncbi:hypothetical protein BC826DRAFT_207546 [Russula brevipes]|nr:hypothetical protein BC826DRAFT_207546 [Russula brevipes]
MRYVSLFLPPLLRPVTLLCPQILMSYQPDVPSGTSFTHVPSSPYLPCEPSSERRGSTRPLSLAGRLTSVPPMRSLERMRDGGLCEPLQRGMDLWDVPKPSLIVSFSAIILG